MKDFGIQTTNQQHIEDAALHFLSNMVKTSPFKGQVFVAGGFVRDHVMNLRSKDIDLVVMAPAGGIAFATWITKKLGFFSSSNPVIFTRFGTAKFNLRNVSHNGMDLSELDIECVMTRKEAYTEGSRKPDVEFGTLQEDVERRDFTVNSLLLDLTAGEVLDITCKGKRDIELGIIQSTIDPDIIFTEDPLRMLRAVRFAAKFGWALPDHMTASLHRNSDKILTISAERIQDELCKMLMIPHRATMAISLLRHTGLLRHILPELNATHRVTQNHFHKDDVFDHTLDVLSKCKPNLVLRLAALFHDIGKVATRTDTDGKVHFKGHEDVGEKVTIEIMQRLRFSNDIITQVSELVRQHMRLKSSGLMGEHISDKALRKFVAEVSDVDTMLSLMHADNMSHADHAVMPDQIPGIRNRLNALPSAVPMHQMKIPVNGHDVMNRLHIKGGPTLKALLDVAREMVFENPDITKEDILMRLDATHNS